MTTQNATITEDYVHSPAFLLGKDLATLKKMRNSYKRQRRYSYNADGIRLLDGAIARITKAIRVAEAEAQNAPT